MESPEERNIRLEDVKVTKRNRQEMESPEERNIRLEKQNVASRNKRETESLEEKISVQRNIMQLAEMKEKQNIQKL